MPENFESQQYRDELSKEIKKNLKEKREEILNREKETPEYWQARTEALKERQDEEAIDDGLGVLVKKKTFYHGSGASGIKKFDKAEEDTVGSGVYFTSEAKDAINYARLRAETIKNPDIKSRNLPQNMQYNEDATPVIYESSVENMKLCDLRKDENVKKVLVGFRDVLVKELKNPNLKFYHQTSFMEAIGAIDDGKIWAGNLKNIAQGCGKLFSDYVGSLGYEGLITLEGGEGGGFNHDTYVIFNPDNVTIDQEHTIAIE
jgi:hypothetical protein